MWPWIFLQLQGIVNHVDTAILRSPAVEGDISTLFRATGVGNPFALATGPGMIINIFVAILYVFLLLGLFSMKIVLTYSVGVIYVAMPLGIILWPIEELAWIPKLLARILGLCLLVPMVWALVFATWGAIGDNAVNFRGSLGQALLQPLITMAMLWMAVFLPHSLLRMAKQGMGGIGGGRGSGQMASMTASRIVSRQAQGFVAAQGLLPFGPEGRITEQRRATQRRSERAESRSEWRAEKAAERSSSGAGASGGGSGATTKAAAGAKKAGTAAAATAATGGTAAAAGAGAAAGAKVGGAGAAQAAGAKGATAGAAQQAGKIPVPPGRERVQTPSVSGTCPKKDHPNVGAANPDSKTYSRSAHMRARDQAHRMNPSETDFQWAWSRLGSKGQNAVHDAIDKTSTPKELGSTLARWSTSDQISNEQSYALLTIAGLVE